jgi:hypothetical protein
MNAENPGNHFWLPGFSKVDRGGIEQSSDCSGNSHGFDSGAAESGAFGARIGPSDRSPDADLDLIARLWPDLPRDVRDAVLRLVSRDVPEDVLRRMLTLLDGSL